MVLALYPVYGWIRDLVGVSRADAFRNAQQIIDWQRRLGIYRFRNDGWLGWRFGWQLRWEFRQRFRRLRRRLRWRLRQWFRWLRRRLRWRLGWRPKRRPERRPRGRRTATLER